MAFIEKKDPVVLNIKLTSMGRELLAAGDLDFKYFAIGDSEIDYQFNAETGLVPFNSNILRPADNNPNIISFINRNLSGDSFNEIGSVPVSSYNVTNEAQIIGFFNDDCNEYLTDVNHIKQPDAMIRVLNVLGGRTLTLLKSPTYGTRGEEPVVGDLLLVKWGISESTTGYDINRDIPIPVLIYRIDRIISGKLSTNNLIVEVDRELPNYDSLNVANIYAGAMILYNFIKYSGDTIYSQYSTDYVDESVLTFLQNSQCSTVIFPFWNMSIIFTEEIAGVRLSDRKFSQLNNVGFGGFVSYIQNQSPKYKKLGIIHYTNSSPANVYAEGFNLNTPSLEIPTIMWHKSGNSKMGVKLICSGNTKLLSGTTTSLNLIYYDLADTFGNIVGKVFTDLKIFVIEDQELLFAMSYKSNRSWTLPNPRIGLNSDITQVTPPPTPPPPPENVLFLEDFNTSWPIAGWDTINSQYIDVTTDAGKANLTINSDPQAFINIGIERTNIGDIPTSNQVIIKVKVDQISNPQAFSVELGSEGSTFKTQDALVLGINSFTWDLPSSLFSGQLKIGISDFVTTYPKTIEIDYIKVIIP